MIDVRSKTIVKIIAGMLVMTFLAQDIVWANPDTLQIPLMTGTLRANPVKTLIEVKLQEIIRSMPLRELRERGYSLVVEEKGERFKISFKTDAENRLLAYCDPITGKTASHRFIVNDDLSISEDKPFSPDIAKECDDKDDVIKYPHSDVAHGFMRADGNGINLYIDVTDLFEGTAPSFKGKNVLVMGCGGGATCFKLALEGAGKVTGVDIDKNSIAIAKTIAPYMRMPLLRNVLSRQQPSIGFEVMDILQTMEGDPEVLKEYEYLGPDTPEFITADARDLSCFQDNSFDYVVVPFMIGVLNGLQDEDIYYTIKEALRVVKPGGILYIEPFSRNATEESEKLISRIIRLPPEQAIAFEMLADIVSYLETDSINGKGLEKVGGSAHSFVVKARPVDIVKKAPYEEDIIEHLYTENVAMVSTNISKETETDFKGAKNLSELLAMLPDRPLEVLDIGTGNGEFCDNLANMYPGRFRHIIGIDKMMGSSTENETGGAKISIRRNMPLEEFQNDKDNQNRFDIVFSNNTEIVRQHFAEILPKILKPGGIAILTFNWHMALTERYRAFETENSIHEFLDPIGGDIAGSMGLGSTAVANLDGYPDTLYTKIPGFIIIHRLPEGDNMASQANAVAEPKPFVAAEDAERNEWKIVKRSIAGLAEGLRDGSKSRLPSSFREHFAGALRRVISDIQDIEKPSPGDVYGLKKDLAMALRILNSTIAYKLSINSAQLKGMFADDFVISSGLQSGIEAALGKNDFIPSYKDADGHAGQLGEIRHINDVFTSIHSRISWLSRVLESRENKSGSPESAEPASIRQDFDVWTDSITYDISQLPYYSSEIQEGISVISVMYAHLLLNSYDAVIKRVESGEEYDYLPKIKIRISLVDAGEGELVLRGSLEDNGTGVSEAALQQLMEEKITTKSVQASDGTNQKISTSDFGGVGLGVLNAISKLTIAFPGRSSIILTTESSDGAFIKMFDPSSGTSTISDIPESGNGRGANIEINIKLTPGQNVEKGVIYEALWAPQSKPFAPDMAKDSPYPREKLRQFRDEVAMAKSRLASAQVTDRFGFLLSLITLVLGRDRKMGELMAHVLTEEVDHDPEMPKYRLEFDRETAEKIIKACPSVKFKVCSDGWRVHTELQEAEDVYALKVLKNSLDMNDDPEEDEPVIINSWNLLSVKQEWRGFDLPAQLTGALAGVLILFIASNLFACSMWWSLLVAPIGFLFGGAIRKQMLSRREGELISLWDAYQIISDSTPQDKPFAPDMAKKGPAAVLLQDVERAAEEAFKRFEAICLEQITLIRKKVQAGQYENMAIHLKEITTALHREFEDPRIQEFKIAVEDMMQDFYAIQLFVDQKNGKMISKLMDSAENVFKGFRQLAAAGKIMEAWKARVSSGVFDLSQVLGNDKPGRKPSPDMVKEEIMLAFMIATIDPRGPDFDGIIGQIEAIRRHLGNNDPPEFIKRFILEDMPLSFVAFQEGAVEGYLLADDRESEIYIDLLEVEPSLQNGGIGSSLLATAIRTARENGNSSMRLHVERKNKGAIRLYRRFGFKEDPEMRARRLPNTIYILDLTKEQIWPYMAKPFAPDMASNNPDKIDNEAVENETKAEQLSREVKKERRRVREIHRRWPAAITTFGSARIPSSDPIHAKAKEFGAAVYKAGLAIRTGAGPSLMEAPLQGYVEARKMAGDKKTRHNMTQGVRVELPFEQKTSKYVEDCYTFKHFVNRKQALYDDCLGIAVFPGGFGTLDEMFEVWSRQQPMVLIGKDYWEPIINTIYEKWRHSGWRGKIEVNFIITDSIDEALEYLHSANNKITPNSLETTDKSGNDIKSLLTELYRWPAAVTIIGQSEFTDRREVDIIAETVSHLVSLGVPVRSGTANRYLKMVLEDVVKGNRDKLQAVLAVLPGRGIARTERRIFTDNIEDHQILLAENSLGYIFLPGKIKTLSRLFDLVSTMQTGKAVRKPIVLVGRDFWQPIKDAIVNGALNYPTAQLIKPQDANLLQIVDTSEEALNILGFGGDLAKPFAPDMDKPAEDEDGPFVIDSNRSFEFEGADIEQGEYELKNIPGGCIYPVIEVSINGRQYKVGNGFYIVVTLANGKKIYWSGQHNLSYAFFFKHYGKDAQRIIDSGGVIWRHVDSSGHLDLGHYSGFRMSPKQDIDPDKEMEFGMNHLTGGNYLGYALTTGIVSYLYRISGLAGAREETLLDQCVPGSTGSLAGMALKNVRGGVSDIDIDIAVNGHAEINDFEAIEKFEKMKDNLCDVAEQGDACFITNSSELSTTYLGVPLYIDPHKALQFSGEVIAELAKRSLKPFAPDMAKETPDEGTFEATVDMLLKEGYKEGRQNVDRLVEHLRLGRVKAGFYYNMLHVRTAADEIGLIISEFMLNKEHMGRGVDLRIFSRLAEKSGSGLGIDIVVLDNGRGIGNIEDAVDIHGYSTAQNPIGRGKGLKLIRRIALEGGGSLEVSSRGRTYTWGNGGVGADEKESVLREGAMIRVVKIFPGIKPLDKPFAPDMAKEEAKDVSDGVKLKPKRIFNQSPDFLAAVDYFNDEILVKGDDGDLIPIDWGRIMDLYEIFRGDRKNADYTPGLRQARMGFSYAARIVDAANNRFSEPAAVLDQALQIYKLSLLQLFIDQPGFREKAIETHQTGDEPHPASGHNRLAWLLMNYFLIRNGYQPFYFKDEDEYNESSIYILKMKEMVRERVIRKRWAELQIEEDKPDKGDAILFEKSFEIKLPADRETADDFRSRALNFIYGLRYARDTKIVPTEQVRKRMHKREGLFRELKEKTGDNPLAYAKEDLVNVWLELLNNAHDGLVSRFLAGELTGNGIVDFKGWIKDGMLVATIEDHGTGVVFQPNGSLVITPKTHEQGFLGRKGVGAKLAEAIVVLKGGEITWKNLENGGTRVIIKIPADMLKTSQAVLGIYEDPLPRSPNDTETALKPVQFLRDIVDTKELTQNMIEGILSALFSNKKLTLAFSKKLKGLESAELRIVVRRLKEWKEATAQNNKRMKALLDNLTILEYDDLRQALAANNIDANARDGLIFTYAPKPADESENTANIGSAVRPVYIIEQDGEFPVHYYYPLLEMVTISLAKELLQWDGSQLKEALLVSKIAVDALGLETAVDEKLGILIFKVLPKIERYNNNSRVDRYTKLLQFLRSA